MKKTIVFLSVLGAFGYFARSNASFEYPKAKGPQINTVKEIQHGVSTISEEMGNWIQSNEEESLHDLEREMEHLVLSGTLRESFFLINTYTNSLSHPSRVLQLIWQTQKEFPPDPPDGDVHHESLTPQVKLRRFEAHATRVLHRRLQGGYALSSAETSALVLGASKRLEEEKSLDVSLNHLELLTGLEAEEEIQKSLLSRSEKDRAFLTEYLLTQSSQ